MFCTSSRRLVFKKKVCAGVQVILKIKGEDVMYFPPCEVVNK